MSNQISLTVNCVSRSLISCTKQPTLQFTKIFRAEQAGEKIGHNSECSKNSHCGPTREIYTKVGRNFSICRFYEAVGLLCHCAHVSGRINRATFLENFEMHVRRIEQPATH